MLMAQRNIAVVRALGGLGDVLCAVPALKRLRHAYPTARVSYYGMPQVAGVVARYPKLVDRFVEFPGFPGVVEAPFAVDRFGDFLAQQRASGRYDLALQLHGSGSVTNVFTAMLDARRMAGFYVPGLWQPEGTFLPFPDRLPEVERWLTLMDALGLKHGEDSLDLPLTDEDRQDLAAVAPDLGPGYAVLHAGASDPRRRWPPEHFARAGDLLTKAGLEVVLTGTASEVAIVAEVEAAMTARPRNLCGRTSLGAAAALIAGAQLVVTNDTGTSHMAAALGTPSVVIFIASDPARWAPLNRARHRVVGRGVPDAVIGRPAPNVQPTLPAFDEAAHAIDALLAVAA